MRLTLAPTLLLVAAAGLIAVGPGGGSTPAGRPASDSSLVIVIEEADACPYGSGSLSPENGDE
jgi:hypothetical protein